MNVPLLARFAFSLALLLGIAGASSPAAAQQPAPAGQAEAGNDSPTWTAEEQARFAKLSKLLTGAKFKGKFTIVGKDDQPAAEEEYTILSAEKAAEKNFWLLTARIKYGDKDRTVPIPIPITWADDTPVISLTNFTIPSLGTFDCRVVLHDGKYAGTWRHGEVSGHLFGTIIPAAESERP